jgi:SAM-dependent methyltransferase
VNVSSISVAATAPRPVALAEKVGPSGHLLGIDISAPTLARARELAPQYAPVEFVLADATADRFRCRSLDLALRSHVLHRPCALFVNLRTALRSEGRLTFACWRVSRENPRLIAGGIHVLQLRQLGLEEPGLFSFASKDRMRRVVLQAGFSKIALDPYDFSLDMRVGRGLDAAVVTALESGPTSQPRFLDLPSTLVAEAAGSISKALAPFPRGQTVQLGAAIWIVTAVDP